MQYAYNLKEKKYIEPDKEKKGLCPLCYEEVVSKCGDINQWHWSHKKNTDCDSFSDGETLWHINWKKSFPIECREVTIKKGKVKHRADILINNKVIEFQNSPINKEEIENRELFYNNMIWVFNCISNKHNFKITEKKGKYGNYFTFRWLHAKRSLIFCSKPIILDLGLDKDLFLIKKIYHDKSTYGWGKKISKFKFIKNLC